MPKRSAKERAHDRLIGDLSLGGSDRWFRRWVIEWAAIMAVITLAMLAAFHFATRGLPW